MKQNDSPAITLRCPSHSGDNEKYQTERGWYLKYLQTHIENTVGSLLLMRKLDRSTMVLSVSITSIAKLWFITVVTTCWCSDVAWWQNIYGVGPALNSIAWLLLEKMSLPNVVYPQVNTFNWHFTFKDCIQNRLHDIHKYVNS